MQKTARAFISRWTTPLWPATLAGVLVGAVIGGLALQASSESEATALIRIHQPIDPDQVMTGTAASAESEQSYIAGEVAYLTSRGFADAVAKQLDEPRAPNLSAIQGVQSSVVSLSATEDDGQQADRTVNAALDVYRDHLRQQTRERGQAAIDAINGVIGRIEVANRQANAELEAAAESESVTAQPIPIDPNDQQAISQLVIQRLAIEAQTNRSASVEVVGSPTVTSVAGAPSWSLGAVGGGLLGGLLALAGALGWRKRLGIVSSPSALEAHIEHVLAPAVRLSRFTEGSDDYTALARSLYAQLPAPRSGRILLVGASPESGTDEVAGLIAYSASEHAEISAVDLHDPTAIVDWSDALADLPQGATIVIDGGCVATSPALPEAAGAASQIVIVAMIGHDVTDAVRMARQLARDSDIPVSAVCTRRAGRKATATTQRGQSAEDDFRGSSIPLEAPSVHKELNGVRSAIPG